MNNKDKYTQFCSETSDIKVFSQPWWLDAVSIDGNWDVALVEKGGVIWGSLPYYYINDWRGYRITMPTLTQTLGPWIKYPKNQKYANKLSHEKEIMTKLIQQLPKHSSFIQNFHYDVTNWLPFYWKGFKQTTRYTYVLENIQDLETIEKNFKSSKRKNISKAEDIVKVKFDLPAKDFYENHKMTLEQEGSKISYSWELFRNLYDQAYAHNSGRTIYAIDKKNNIHSALFIIWDSMSAYDLISTIDHRFRNSGSATYLVWKMLEYLSNNNIVNKFDFEGSMIEGVENSFRAFGAKQIPYFQVYKHNSILSRTIKATKTFLK